MPRTAPGNPLFLRDEAIDLQFEWWLLAGAGLQRALGELLGEQDIDPFDFFILAIIGRRRGRSMADLVELSGRPKQVLSRRIQLLHRRGLLVRATDKADRRRQLLDLSEDGAQLLEQAMEKQRHYLRRAFSRAGSTAVDGFSAVLGELAAPAAAKRFPLPRDQDR